jgi:NADPH:quinone reductase-like Zn-dependent oxidoreductase
MKAVRIHEFGGSDQVRVEEVPTPSIEAGKALIRIRAAAVNPVDWMIRERIYNPEGAEAVPMTLGQDFSGTVEALPPEARSALGKGEAVFGEAWGAFAEYALVPITDLVRKPEALPFEVAAAAPMAALTAWQAVVDAGRARPGTRFLIHGAGGGVGSFAAQFAKLKGAEVIATASQASQAFLREVGVDRIIDYQRERFEEIARDVDVVLDPLGGDTQARSWATLKRGGMLINLIGDLDEKAAKKAGVRGVLFAMRYDTDDLAEIADLMARGLVKPHIDKLLPLDDASKALDLNQTGRSHGKIVLQVP